MSDQSMTIVPRRLMTPEQKRQRRMMHPTPGRKGYDERTKERVIKLLERGEHTMEQICALPGMPHNSTVWDWFKSDPEFASRYENAKKVRAAACVERALSEVLDAKHNADTIRVADVRARQLMRAAALFDPMKYSEKMHGALNRLPTGNAVQININIGGQTAEAVTIEGKTADKYKSGS